MTQPESKSKAKILRFFWGLFPWLFVAGLVWFVFNMVNEVGEKKVLLEEARKAEIKEKTPAVRVITLEMEPQKLEDKINLPAIIEPFENLWVKAEVSGLVVNSLVREGDTVEKGQVLVELDDRDYVARLERIHVNYDQALLDHKRIAELAKKRIAAETDLDQINTKMRDLQTQLQEAELALNRTRIKAPISGRVNEISAKVGDRLGVDKPVAQILQFETVKVNVGVPESDVEAVFDINEADVIIDALGKRKVKGKKYFLSRQPRTLAMLYDLELLVQNPDGRILPGMFARVDLVKKVIPHAMVIPLYSVITLDQDVFVYIEKDGKAHKRTVELGILSNWQIQVKSGLEPGDRVIVVGHRLLDEGQDVEIVKNVNNPAEIIGS